MLENPVDFPPKDIEMRFTLLNFREVLEDDALKLLKWRQNPRVASKMATEFNGDEQSQRLWILNSRKREDYYHWIIVDSGVDIGLVSINQFDHSIKSVHWGIYIGDDDAVGKGAFVPAYLYNWLFTELDIKTIHTETFEENKSALAMHKFFGYKGFPERNRRVFNSGVEKTLIAMDLDRTEWLKQTRFQELVAEFPTTLWTGREY